MPPAAIGFAQVVPNLNPPRGGDPRPANEPTGPFTGKLRIDHGFPRHAIHAPRALLATHPIAAAAAQCHRTHVTDLGNLMDIPAVIDAQTDTALAHRHPISFSKNAIERQKWSVLLPGMGKAGANSPHQKRARPTSVPAHKTRAVFGQHVHRAMRRPSSTPHWVTVLGSGIFPDRAPTPVPNYSATPVNSN